MTFVLIAVQWGSLFWLPHCLGLLCDYFSTRGYEYVSVWGQSVAAVPEQVIPAELAASCLYCSSGGHLEKPGSLSLGCGS